LLGETGVGKTAAAERLHTHSGRSGPLVKLNCAAVPEALLEGELFGYERGAFTGAQVAKAGLIEAATNGTLLLDEIGDMPLATQAKLLHVVEQGEVTRLGAIKPRTIDVRFLAATHRDLTQMVAAGTFRADLYYRVNGISIEIPPLRERPEEILGLAEHFLMITCVKIKRDPPMIGRAATAAMLAYPWPGNLRELRNVMDRVALLARGNEVPVEALGLPAAAGSTPWAGGGVHASAMAPGPSAPTPYMGVRAVSGTAPTVPPASPSGGNLRDDLDSFEKEKIVRALEEAGGNQAKAAELVGLPLRTFVKRLTHHGLTKARKKDS
jgi:DNA-binding NtrC family response regulator